MISIDKSFDIFLKLCTRRDLKITKIFLTQFVVANSYAHNILSLEKLISLKNVKNIEDYILKRFTIKKIFSAIDKDKDKEYVILVLTNLLFK